MKSGALAGSVLFWIAFCASSLLRHWEATAAYKHRHCEERSDEAIQTASLEAVWIASLRSQ
jgi:hypothetical protein